ncbi:hypothetical protein HY477_04030 [Candidatus Uhrbacteria bacterium]|nr:hypothetical protein [Candidatus Uhrbacteria bacterium]
MLPYLRRTSKLITPFLIVFLIALSVTAVFAQDKAGFGLEETAAAGGLISDANSPPAFGPATVAGRIVGYLLAFVGVIFFALMIWGGILWMTARGNEDQVKKALDLIKSAIIGMVIVFASYVITNFVLTRLTRAF